MPRFIYHARDAQGQLATGVLEADGAEQAGAMLRGGGKFIVALDRAAEGDDAKADRVKPRGKIKRSDVITVAHQMAVMVDTGVPIAEALTCIAEQTLNEAFRAVIEDVSARVAAGGELSAALGAYPKVFPPVMTSLIRASEVSGTMGAMLERISRYLQKEMQTAKKIKGALTYPCVMLTMVVLVTVFLMVWVLPRFAGIYQSKGAALPVPTRILLAMSDGLIGYWWAWLGGAALAVSAVMLGIRTDFGRRLLDTLKLRTPVLGPLFNRLYLTRGCRTMGTMIASGVPILDMIDIVRRVTVNTHYEAMWDEVDAKLRQGSQLSDAIFASPLIPRSVAQMIYAGEKAGRLGDVMGRIAEFTEEDFDEAVKKTTQFIEPAMVGIMGLIIGFVAIALLLPIFSVGKVVSG